MPAMIEAITHVMPRSLKQRVRGVLERRVRAERAAMLSAIPRVDLAPEHVAHLRGVEDRARLMELLPTGGVGAEIGVSRGRFTAIIMQHNRPRKLHLIDAWASARYDDTLQQTVMRTFAAPIADGVIEINRGYSTAVAETFPDAYFDWIYIDTDHSYETTRAELALYEPKMKPGGVIAGHDYAMGNWRDGIKYGVIEAVHEFCVKRRWELIHVTTELTTNASFAIRRLPPSPPPRCD